MLSKDFYFSCNLFFKIEFYMHSLLEFVNDSLSHNEGKNFSLIIILQKSQCFLSWLALLANPKQENISTCLLIFFFFFLSFECLL